MSWDAPIHRVDDILALARPPRIINIKPVRFGSLRALCAAYDYCETHGIAMYGGGFFELGPGRGQIQYLASLFHPDAPNDVSPRGLPWRRCAAPVFPRAPCRSPPRRPGSPGRIRPGRTEPLPRARGPLDVIHKRKRDFHRSGDLVHSTSRMIFDSLFWTDITTPRWGGTAPQSPLVSRRSSVQSWRSARSAVQLSKPPIGGASSN